MSLCIGKEKKKNTCEKWLHRLSGYYDSRFQGTNLRDQEKISVIIFIRLEVITEIGYK